LRLLIVPLFLLHEDAHFAHVVLPQQIVHFVLPLLL
jgi:hypothetical protein